MSFGAFCAESGVDGQGCVSPFRIGVYVVAIMVELAGGTFAALNILFGLDYLRGNGSRF